MIKTFQRGLAIFPCKVWGRKTRNVGDNGCCDLCPQCYDLGGIENEISDGHCTVAEKKIKIKDLMADIEVRGGDSSAWKETFSLND